ncbi:MAG: hypothetical protein GY913_31385 [Proteobacteria bacterium]|nr:hypothetical protein [Pseudomonadota bacterium]
MQKAVTAYEKAAAFPDSAFHAHFNLGALYDNQAAAAAMAANDTMDEAAHALHSEAMAAALTAARPHFEKAHELNPTDTTVLDGLMQRTMMTGDLPEYEVYKARRAALE